MRRKLLLAGAALVPAAALWTAGASLGFAALGHVWSALPWPDKLWCWWRYAIYAAGDPGVAAVLQDAVPLGFGAVLGGAALALHGARRSPTLQPRFWQRQDDVVRGATNNHGRADWMPLAEVRRLFAGRSGCQTVVVVGEAYRVDQDRVAAKRFDPRNRKTWGRGGTAPLLVDPCETGSTHSLCFAGSGGFKTQSALATGLAWGSSMVVLDPSGEIGTALAEPRRATGHRVFCLDPRSRNGIGLNALAWIDTGSATAGADVHAVVSWIYTVEKEKSDNGNHVFEAAGRELVACLLAHMLWDTECPAELKTLATLRAGITMPAEQLKARLAHIHKHSPSGMARQLAGSVTGIPGETWGSITFNATTGTAWLSNPAYAELVSGNSFGPADLLGGDLSVFLQIPEGDLLRTPGLARCLVGALMNTLLNARPDPARGRVLFLLDEAKFLGRLGTLEHALIAGRKYGVTMMVLLQSYQQLVEVWGQPGAANWIESVSRVSFAGVKSKETAELVSALSGRFAALASSEGTNSGSQAGRGLLGGGSRGQNQSLHEIGRALILPQEVMAARADEQFIFGAGQPIRCGRAIAFRRPDMVALLALPDPQPVAAE